MLRGKESGDSCRRYYEDLDALHEVWDALVDDNGWIETADPAEGEQHDAFPTGHASAAQK